METANLEVTLEDENPATFEFSVKWLYHGNFGHDDLCNYSFIEAYILADRLMYTKLKDNCIDMLLQYYVSNYIQSAHLIRVFERLGESHLTDFPIKQLAYDLSLDYNQPARQPEFEVILEIDGNITKRIMEQMRHMLMSPGGRHAPAVQYGCTWHGHERTERECNRY